MICPHCKRALDEALEKIEKATEVNWSEVEEERMKNIMQNGNNGEHYDMETRQPWNDRFDEEER